MLVFAFLSVTRRVVASVGDLCYCFNLLYFYYTPYLLMHQRMLCSFYGKNWLQKYYFFLYKKIYYYFFVLQCFQKIDFSCEIKIYYCIFADIDNKRL